MTMMMQFSNEMNINSSNENTNSLFEQTDHKIHFMNEVQEVMLIESVLNMYDQYEKDYHIFL